LLHPPQGVPLGKGLKRRISTGSLLSISFSLRVVLVLGTFSIYIQYRKASAVSRMSQVVEEGMMSQTFLAGKNWLTNLRPFFRPIVMYNVRTSLAIKIYLIGIESVSLHCPKFRGGLIFCQVR
jgi:hypothetical protein